MIMTGWWLGFFSHPKNMNVNQLECEGYNHGYKPGKVAELTMASSQLRMYLQEGTNHRSVLSIKPRA